MIIWRDFTCDVCGRTLTVDITIPKHIYATRMKFYNGDSLKVCFHCQNKILECIEGLKKEGKGQEDDLTNKQEETSDAWVFGTEVDEDQKNQEEHKVNGWIHFF